MKQKTKTIALIAIMVMVVFVAICAFSSAAVEEDTSDKISGYLKYTMKQGYPEMVPVEKPDITAVGKPVKPLKIAMAEDKVAKGVKGVRKRENLPSMIGGVITTESPLTEDQVKQLESLDVVIRSRMGTVTTVNMPKDRIQDIASLDYIRYIEGARPVRMHLDAAVPEMGADQAWTDGYTGDDVIIGIADTGIDVNHGDFYFDAAKNDSKILYLWDQVDNLTGPAPAPYGYGTEWTKAQIDAGLCTENDTDGHGTHVAGITASTGLETGNYSGVAPDANIIFVKTTFWDIDIIDGWKYIVERAQAEGKPCVISCSIGTYFSPHDGTDPMAQAADWCAAQGVLVICSAGNEGDWPVHATIQQPRTEIWSDDFDSGFGNWVTDGGNPTWHRVTDRSTSPDYSTYPGMCMDICKYVNNQNSTMTMASSIDLSGTTSPNVTFQLWSEIESGYDYLDIDVSSDGGTTWTNVAGYDGAMDWTGQSIDLSPYKSDQVNVRFRFVSDDIVTYEGPYIDDVAISDGATTLWSDDFESGFGNWTTDGDDPTWHQEDSRSYSGSYSAYLGMCMDICEYVNDQDSTMTMASSIDLSGTTYPVLAFQLWSDIEFDYDFLYVDVSSDGGTNWREVWSYGDYDRNWRGMIVDLTPYKSDQVKVRFRFVSDYSDTYEGPYIDDVAISDQSSVCGGTYAEDDTYNLEVALDPRYRESLVDLYYDLDDNVSIEVRTNNGYVIADEADAYGSGDGWQIEVDYVEGPNWKNYFIYAFDTDPSRNEMIEIHTDAVGPGGVNRWDAWTLPSWYMWGYFRDVDDMDYFMSVGSPASAQNVIAVGAYTTKDCWDDIDGNSLYYPFAVMDDLAYFSSHGPTRDCRMKPELTASGFGVMSALSGDSSPDSRMVDSDGAHQMMSGTSMSAPMVAGAVALGLECNPDASPSELRSYFMETAREDVHTRDTWPSVDNQYWGAGKVWSDSPCYPKPPMPVPAFTPPGITALIGLLSLAGFVMLRRRK